MFRWHTVLTKISFFKARENLRCEIWMKMERKRILNQRIRRKNADFLECRDITLRCLSSCCFCFIHTLGTYVEDYLMLHLDKSSYTARSPPYTKFSCSIVLKVSRLESWCDNCFFFSFRSKTPTELFLFPLLRSTNYLILKITSRALRCIV